MYTSLGLSQSTAQTVCFAQLIAECPYNSQWVAPILSKLSLPVGIWTFMSYVVHINSSQRRRNAHISVCINKNFIQL